MNKSIKNKVFDTVNELFSESKSNDYFLIKNKSTQEVRHMIEEKIDNTSIDYDLYIYISSLENDTIIKFMN